MNHNSLNRLARLLPAILGLAAAVRVNAQEYTFTTLEGPAETPGAVDGRGSAARFNYPQGVAVDRAGNLYVADGGNNNLRLDPRAPVWQHRARVSAVPTSR